LLVFDYTVALSVVCIAVEVDELVVVVLPLELLAVFPARCFRKMCKIVHFLPLSFRI